MTDINKILEEMLSRGDITIKKMQFQDLYFNREGKKITLFEVLLMHQFQLKED